jgi:hypothetical protein
MSIEMTEDITACDLLVEIEPINVVQVHPRPESLEGNTGTVVRSE